MALWASARSTTYWLLYRPELDFLKSRDAVLGLPVGERIAAGDPHKRHLVFAPARYVPQKKLLELGVEHAPLPYALYRIEKAQTWHDRVCLAAGGQHEQQRKA